MSDFASAESVDYIIVGYGIASMSVLLALASKEHPFKIAIFDEYFDGGNLRRNYGTVRSNTVWTQFLQAVEPYCSSMLFNNLKSLHGPDETTTLNELVFQFQRVVKATLASSPLIVHYYCRKIKALDFHTDCWHVDSQLEGRTLILTPGATPKSLNYPKPTLQLASVLNNKSLPARPGEHVLVFGTSHSGTLAIDALHKQSLKVSAVYHGSNPFKFARDGEYDGIKQESALIADNLPATIKLIAATDENSIRTELLSADWILYACGFNPATNDLHLTVNSVPANINQYDATTGQLTAVPKAFGYGIAYPNSNVVDGKTYYDVSLPAFMKHIHENINKLTSFQATNP